MKEFMLKHPILTFLLVDSLIAGLFNTIRAFAPNGEKTETEDGEKPEGDPEEDLAQHISKEETK